MEWTYSEGREINRHRGGTLSVLLSLGITCQQSSRDGAGNSVGLHCGDAGAAADKVGECECDVSLICANPGMWFCDLTGKLEGGRKEEGASSTLVKNKYRGHRAGDRTGWGRERTGVW